jgi:phosphohistidine phosphatase
MELLLVRHAIAQERDPRRWPDDGERPLSAGGAARARTAAAGLKHITERPALVLTSPLLRTRQTAAILTQVARWPRARQCAPLAPGSAPEELFALLAREPAARIALVGHEPDLGELLGACLARGAGTTAFEFKKMGVARVGFDGPARAGRGQLLWLLPPKILRAIRA